MRYLVPVDACRAGVQSVQSAMSFVNAGDEVVLLYVLLDSSSTARAQAEELLQKAYGAVLERSQGPRCSLHAICIRSWREAGRPAGELIARAICAKAHQLNATVILRETSHTACLPLPMPVGHRRSVSLQKMLKSGRVQVIVLPEQHWRPMSFLRSTQKWMVQAQSLQA